MKTYVIVFLIFVSLLYTPHLYGSSLKIIGSNWIYAVAVSGRGKIYKGVLINISVVITPGEGDVYISTSPLAEKDMQASAMTAARIACETLGKNFFNYNFYYKIVSNAIIVGGPSAGIPLTIVTFSALSNIPINRSVLATGMINPDGAIGPVGGIPEKSEAAAKFGAKLFLIPYGQSIVTKYELKEKHVGPFIFTYISPVKINMTKYAMEKWGLRIREVKNIYEAIRYMTGYKINITENEFKIKKNYPIIQDISDALVKKARDYYNNVLKEINSSNLYFETKKQFINTLRKYSLSQLKNIEKSDPYSSYSAAFNSLVNSEWIHLVYIYYSHNNVTREISKIEEEVNQTLEVLKNIRPDIDDHSLSSYIASINYALISLQNLNDAKSLWEENIYDSLYYTSLSKWNIYISKQWMKNISTTGKTYNLSSLHKIAETYLAEAKSTLSYTSTLLEETGSSNNNIRRAVNTYELAKEMYEKQEYMFSLVESIISLSYAETSFDTWISNTGVNPGYLITHTRSIAIISMNKVSDKTPPIFSILLFRQAENTTKFNNKIFYYKLSSYYAKLLHDISSYKNISSTNIEPIHKEKTSNTIEPQRIKVYLAAISFILTLFIILVIAILVLYIIKRRYT